MTNDTEMPVMPTIKEEFCKGCGLCMLACPGGGIVKADGKVKVMETENCDYCGVCEWVCPNLAMRCEYIIVLGEEE